MVPETESTSVNRSCPSLKKLRIVAGLLASTEGRAEPAPGPSSRTPGSTWANRGNEQQRMRARVSGTTRCVMKISLMSRWEMSDGTRQATAARARRCTRISIDCAILTDTQTHAFDGAEYGRLQKTSPLHG